MWPFIYPKRFVSIVVYQSLQQTSAAPCGALDLLMFANLQMTCDKDILKTLNVSHEYLSTRLDLRWL